MLKNLVVALLQLCKSLSWPSNISDMSEIRLSERWLVMNKPPTTPQISLCGGHDPTPSNPCGSGGQAKPNSVALQESRSVFIYFSKAKQSTCLISTNSSRNLKLQHEPFHCKLFELSCYYLPACRGSSPPTGRTPKQTLLRFTYLSKASP